MSEGEGKYVPTEEELQRAEDSMSERQKDISSYDESALFELGRYGVSEEDALKAVETLEKDNNSIKINICGHEVVWFRNNSVTVDGSPVEGDKVTLLNYIALVHNISKIGGRAGSGEIETARIIEEGEKVKAEGDQQRIKNASRDIFKNR